LSAFLFWNGVCLNQEKNKKVKAMSIVKFKNGNGSGTMPALDRPLSFPSFFSDTLERLWSDETLNWMPAVNIRERADDFVIDLAVPGMDKKDFTVEVDNGVLTVSGERRGESEDKSDKHTRREFHYVSFRRHFSLPDTANGEQVNASYKDGILTLIVMKREESRLKPKRQIKID
jgi:HSP20 family molecular chaperone IbpA